MPSSSAIASWNQRLHSAHILLRSAYQPDPNQVLSPSNTSSRNLAGSLTNAKECQKSRDAPLDEDKEGKKGKFKDFSNSKKGMLLNLMT